MNKITVLQAPEDIDNKIESLVVKKGIKSLNAIWKNIRLDKSTDFIGDYPLMSHLLNILSSHADFKITKEALTSMIRTSKFYMDEGKRLYIPGEWEKFINAEKPIQNPKTLDSRNYFGRVDKSSIVQN